MVEAELKADHNVYPTAQDQARFFTVRAVPQTAERARTRVWAQFKAGQ